MSQVKTVVQSISDKKYNGKTFYSFKGQDGVWYGTGTRTPPETGAYVEFEALPNDKGFLQASNIVRLPNTAAAVSSGPRVAAAAVKGAQKASGNKDDYWANKEIRDVTVQKRIEIQSCRNSALTFISQLLQAEAIPVPTKKAEREEYLQALLKRYTTQFLEENNGETQPVSEPEKTDTVADPAEDDAVWGAS
jgi:hypothetical protein